MLVSKYGRQATADFDSIHNYYEQLVYSRLLEKARDQDINPELLPDIACVALNHLPPRYIRHDVDMTFYLSPKEYEEIENKVELAVSEAITFVVSRGLRDGTPS